MSSIPKDPVMLLSFVNLKLRDYYSSFDAFCDGEDADGEEISKALALIDYHYDETLNKFV
jgi:hypothetical protein